MTILRRRLFYASGTPEPIRPSDAEAGDICLYDNVEQKLIIIRKGTLKSYIYPSYRYEPVGVVVVPGHHVVSFYGDWTCGVIGLKAMSLTSPDSGTVSPVSNPMYAFGGTISIGDSENYSGIIYVGKDSDGSNSESKITNTVEGLQTTFNSSNVVCLACDANLSTQDAGTFISNKYDLKTKYQYRGVDTSTSHLGTYYYAPSPYTTAFYHDFEYPYDYYKGSALADADGIYRNEEILTYATSQTNWKTSSSITNSSASGYCPLFCCIWRYHTNGTKQGDWYLPSAGETAIMISRLITIDDSINEIKSVYGDSSAITLLDECDNYATAGFYTSTFYNSTSLWKFLINGDVMISNGSFHGRPMLRVLDEDQS